MIKKIYLKKIHWDFKLLQTPDDPNFTKLKQQIKENTKEFVEKWQNDQSYLSNPKPLLIALNDYQKWLETSAGSSDLGYFSILKSSLDQLDPKINAAYQKTQVFSKQMSTQIQFFTIKLSKISKQKQHEFLNNSSLKPFHQFLKQLFLEGEHTLSNEEEKIFIHLHGPAKENWVQMLSKFLSQETRMVYDKNNKRVKKSFNEIISLMNDENPKTRDFATKTFNSILLKHKNVAEAEINSVLQYKQINDEFHKFKRPDAERHMADNIPSKVVDLMLDTVEKDFSTSREYYQFKAKLFGKNKLKYHERNLRYGNLNKHYSYATAIDLVYQTYKKLDPEFANILSRFNENGQIDVRPNKGKAGGAFCIHYLKKHPTFVLLNFTDQLQDVITLAHEMGHAINNELMRIQPAIYFGTPTSTAEVASTFFEDFVLQALFDNADDELKLGLLMMKLDNEISTIHRQVAAYRFEQQLHAQFKGKSYLAADDIGKMFHQNMYKYMGDAIEHPKDSYNWWIYWSHIRTHFYVYSYASGLLISKVMQEKVKKSPEFIKNVKQFLSAGESNSPTAIFRNMNIDIQKSDFWQTGLKDIQQTLKKAKKLAKKLGKI